MQAALSLHFFAALCVSLEEVSLAVEDASASAAKRRSVMRTENRGEEEPQTLVAERGIRVLSDAEHGTLAFAEGSKGAEALTASEFGKLFGSLPVRKRLADAAVLTSLLDEPRFLGLPQRLLEQRPQPAPPLDRLCVADTVGGEALASDVDFQRQAQRGHRAAASKSIIFAGLLRDIGDSAHQLFERLRRAGDAFARYHIIVLENNSKDSTREAMSKECQSQDVWCFELDISQLQESKQDARQQKRVEHLTLLRQSLLEQVRRFLSVSPVGEISWDFLVNFDGDLFAEGAAGFQPSMLDALLGFPVNDGAKTQLFAEAPYDFVCANQLANWPRAGRYRDTFALRRQSWFEEKMKNDDESIYFSGNKLVPVKSCFSGLALYSLRSIEQAACNYTFKGEATCEHVSFHRCLANRGFGKAAIYPALANIVNDNGDGPGESKATGRVAEVCADIRKENVIPASLLQTSEKRRLASRRNSGEENRRGTSKRMMSTASKKGGSARRKGRSA
jgi:hypothetical protein